MALAATSGAYTRTRAASFADTSSTGFAVGGQPLRQRPASARVDIRDIPRPSMLEGFVS